MPTSMSMHSMTESMQVSIETTPNPSTLKFQFSDFIFDAETTQGFEFTNSQEAEISPLAAKIFGFPWTSGIYLGPNFMTVTKQDWVDWDILAEPLANIIKSHFENGEPVYLDFSADSDEDLSGENSADSSMDSDYVKKIKRALATEIRPIVAMDGGDIAFVKEENGVLFIKMKGACSGCPSSQATLKDGIEVRMRELFPELLQVVAV